MTEENKNVESVASSEESTPAGVSSTNAGSSEVSKEDKVAYDTHRKLLSQRKKDQEKLAAIEAELESYRAEEQKRELKKLEDKGEYEKILSSYKEENSRLKNQIDEGKRRSVESAKLQAFVNSLPGKLRNQQYLAFVDTNEIAVDPETNTVDEVSLKRTVDDFLRDHSSLIEPEKVEAPRLPNRSSERTTITNEMSNEEKLKLALTAKLSNRG